MKKFASIRIGRKTFQSFFLVALMTFVAKMAIVLKEVVVASRFGRQDELDAFLIAFLLPSFAGSLLAGAMTSSFIPVYLEVDAKKGRAAARDLFADTGALNLVATCGIMGLTFLCGYLVLPGLASGFDDEKIRLVRRLLLLLLPYVLFSGISSLWSAMLNAQERFALVILTPLISPLLIVFFLILFPEGGINTLSMGVLAGAFLEALVLGIALAGKGFLLWPRWRGWRLHDAGGNVRGEVGAVIRQFIPAAAAACLMGSTLLVDQSMASMLPSSGSVAALSYGNKAIGFLLALLSTTLVTFLTPYFSKMAIGGREILDRLLKRWLVIAFPLGLLVSMAIVLFSTPLVRLVFFRGAFTIRDIAPVASVQSWLAWQIPFYVCAVILTRYMAAMRWNRVIFGVAACNVILNIVLNRAFMNRMGVSGIALSTSIVHACSMLMLTALVMVGKGPRPFSRGLFFLRGMTKILYRFRGLGRLADLIRMAYIHHPVQLTIEDFDGDLRFSCSLDEHIGSQIFWRGSYSTRQVLLLRDLLRPGMVFLDAGANIGEFTVLAAKYVRDGKVLAFEPVEQTARELEANLALNGFRNVTLYRKGLGSATGEKTLYHTTEEQAKKELNQGLFSLFPRPGLDRPCGTIDLISLDALAADWMETDMRIDVMKIDIEGGELDMLQGAEQTIRRCRPAILIEVNAITSMAAGYEPGKILLFLENLGYQCYRIGRKGALKRVGLNDLGPLQDLVCFPEGWKGHLEDKAGGRRASGRIAFFIPDLRAGGAEKSVCHLLNEMKRQRPDLPLQLVLANARGPYIKELSTFIPVTDLGCKRMIYALPALTRYLRRERPAVLVSHLSHANVIALIAARLAGGAIRVIVVEHGLPYWEADKEARQTRHTRHRGKTQWRIWQKEWWVSAAVKKTYRGAAACLAVSKAGAAILMQRLGLPKEKGGSIYNPVVDQSLVTLSKQPPEHPWLVQKDTPVLLAVGRLEPVKDQITLLEAFARLRATRLAKLILLGEGSQRKLLEDCRDRLGFEADVDMPGFEENPYAFMTHSDMLVSTSRSEGLGNVLIEAMACGCPVISTDCPGGPREILEDGKWGRLVPVGDIEALVQAMRATLDEGPARISRYLLKERAAKFSAEKAATAWFEKLDPMLDGRPVFGGEQHAGGGQIKRRVVLHVITGLGMGGAERMLCDLQTAFDDQRWESVVISLNGGGAYETWLKEQGIPVFCLGMRSGSLPGPRVLIRLARLARRIRPDLIHGWMYHGNLAALYIRWFLSKRIPLLWSIHHAPADLATEKKMTAKMIRMGARFSFQPSRIIYTSNTSARQHHALGYLEDKTVIIPNGVDPARWRPSENDRAAIRMSLGLSPTALVIGSLARYHPMKDHQNLLQAAGILCRNLHEEDAVPSLHFVLAGAGVDEQNQALKELIGKEKLGDRVLLLGERKDAMQLMNAFDIFTLSSSHESFPRVLLEAMACGLACVTTDVGDAALLVGDSGLVVAARDPGALAKAWQEMIGADVHDRMRAMGDTNVLRAYGMNDVMRAYGARARKRIVDHYALTICAAAYAGLYEELIGPG